MWHWTVICTTFFATISFLTLEICLRPFANCLDQLRVSHRFVIAPKNCTAGTLATQTKINQVNIIIISIWLNNFIKNLLDHSIVKINKCVASARWWWSLMCLLWCKSKQIVCKIINEYTMNRHEITANRISNNTHKKETVWN